ncbi:MAG: methyltransferase domain-containing protein [Oligoflexia bacterium]|nr:methyltransferase domain-containing protein [Oligoflexia bacterium]
MYQNITGDDVEADRMHWDSLFNQAGYVYGRAPAAFLKEHIALLPVGKALDIAMGEGRNGVFLAKKGFQVTGVDYSEIALTKARRLAHENRVTLRTVNADLTEYTIKPEAYDVIVDIDFVLRSLIPEIKKGLKHGGMVVFESQTEDQLANTGGNVIRKDWLLKKGELRELFKDWDILVYREVNDGKDARASIIARKP